MEDELDKILKENKPKIKHRILTLDYWKGIFLAIYTFIYLFFYSLIYQAKNPNDESSNNRNLIPEINRNMTSSRRPEGYRYRSR